MCVSYCQYNDTSILRHQNDDFASPYKDENLTKSNKQHYLSRTSTIF